MPVRWSQAINFRTFPTLIKQCRNSVPKETGFPHRKTGTCGGSCRPSCRRRGGRFRRAGPKTRRSASPLRLMPWCMSPGFRIGALSRFKTTSYRGSHSLAGLIGLSGEMPGESFGLKPVSKL
jgi:hypothetical protein